MNRAVGIYAVLAENKANVPTVAVVGKGPRPEGLIGGTEVDQDEEGILCVAIPNVGIVQMFALDVPDSKAHDASLEDIVKTSKRLANRTNQRFELVRFGENGREHVRWIG